MGMSMRPALMQPPMELCAQEEAERLRKEVAGATREVVEVARMHAGRNGQASAGQRPGLQRPALALDLARLVGGR